MNEIFDLLFSMFGSVIGWLKEIPVWNNVSLYDFSIGILIMSIVIVAFVPIVSVGSTNYVNETLNAERIAQRKSEQEESKIESREYGLLSRSQKRVYLNEMKDKRGNK